jgi:hypothetical protein
VFPLKHISRAAVGPYVALAWPRNYTKDRRFLDEYKMEFRFTVADIISFGHFYFLGLRLPVPQLETLHDGIHLVDGSVSDAALKCVGKGIKWLEQLTMCGVVDLMHGGGFDHLTAMWTLGASLPRQ